MRADILQSRNSKEVTAYVDKKFRSFDSWTYSKSTRIKKCINYYLCASDENKRIVEMEYQAIFRQLFPIEQAEKVQDALDRKAAGPVMVEQSVWLKSQSKRKESAEQLLDQLLQWRKDKDYQLGPDFYVTLRDRVRAFNPNLVDPREFLTEKEAKRVATLTGKTTKSAKDVQTEFDALIGIRQKAEVKFEAYSPNWGQINVALSEDFKAGAWASGSAAAALKRRGFKAEVQAAVGIGAELNIDGSCTWKGANHGLDLSGNCNLFVGAKASMEAKLSADLFKGIDVSLSAGGFAGVSASVNGKCSFTYADKTMLGLEASAAVQFGVGGSLSGSLSVPIFGATKIGFATSVAVGLGVEVSTKTEIHFTQIYLAGREDFQRLIYLPTIAKGYQMDLMTDDAKNLHYLDKCIARVGDGVTGIEEKMASVTKLPEDQQAFLMKMDDND